VAGQQGQIDDREHVVHGVVMFGDAEGPADLGAVGTRVGMRHLAQDLRLDAGQRLTPFECVRLHRRLVDLKPGGRPLDKRRVAQPGGDNLAPDRVGQRDIGPDLKPEPHVGPRDGAGPSWIDGVQPRAVLLPRQQMVEEDRVRLTGV
jgi:hypothetical protein